MNKKALILTSLCALLVLSACGSKSETSSEGGNVTTNNNPKRLNWESIPEEFKPETKDVNFSIAGIEKVNVDAFGFKDDVEVVYVDSLAKDSGILRVFSVYKTSASWGDLSARTNGKNLDLKNYGTYQCSINISNGQITKLEGGCYVRLQIILPTGSEVEVYNVGSLISKRFIPIDALTFLENFDDATWDKDKHAAIDDFLNSYAGMAKKPTLTVEQLAVVINDFIRKDDKFTALRKLHPVVSDRQNLAAMIEKEFSYFDREEARKIVGI